MSSLYASAGREILATAVFASAALFPVAADALDSTKIGTAPLIDPSSAETYYTASTTSSNSIGTTAYPNEIVELAKALNNNVDEIYDFVRNYVDTVFIFGAQKGALGAIVDKSGTPFDQAKLMVDLLRQAGYATANYKVGQISLSGAQFQAWTNITNAQAACNLLASGGIPARINGSSASFLCSSLSNTTTVSTVQLEHVWVGVTINGTEYLFDPSYKPYNWRLGVNLTGAAGLSSGQALSAATSTATQGAAGAVGYVQNLSEASLDSQLNSYAAGVQNYIQTQNSALGVPLASGQIKDLVGGGDIQRFAAPTGGQRITALPYPAQVTWAWTGNVPDQFRTTLRLQLTYDLNGTFTQILDKTLFVDEIYGRKLIYNTNFNAHSFAGSLQLIDEFGNANSLSTYTINQSVAYSSGKITLSANHPYAADATGTGTGGTYMDDSVTKAVTYATPFTIVNGWGDANMGLIDKWSSRPDQSLPQFPPQGCDTCTPDYNASAGDGRREGYAANWLVQASKAARLHAALANSIYTHHHTIGISSGDATVHVYQTSPPNQTPITYGYSVGDNLDVIDVETGFSLTSTSSDPLGRRAAIHAIAATQAALEGSVIAQVADVPDTTSVARRFQWGNAPPASEDPSGLGARAFYEFNSSNGSNPTTQVQPLMVVEGAATTSNSGIHAGGEPTIGSLEYTGRELGNAQVIAEYAAAGFTVIAPGESFLGPGQRGGMYIASGTNQWTHLPSMQRGGALVATRYDTDGVDPLEIAHVVSQDAGRSTIKGGGGGIQPEQDSRYDPSTAADVLKTRFIDRSVTEGVDLKNGSVSYTSPATVRVGNGGFPYELSASLIWRGGNLTNAGFFGPLSTVEPQAPWTTNWNNSLTISGSGLEAMGENEIRASAGTVAAFLAMQDTYKQPVSRQREVTGALVTAWWVNQISGNVASVSLGNDTRQFLKRYDGTWVGPGPASYATLTQTGQRVPYTEPNCRPVSPNYILTRGWDYSGVSFTVTNAHGDVQNFPYWANNWQSADLSCAKLHGFRLSSWTFPQGVTINFVYTSPGSGQLDQLTEVNNSLGRKIDFTWSVGGLSGFSNGLSSADPNYRGVTVAESGGYPTTTGTTTITDPAGAVTRVYHTTTGYRLLLNQIFEANNSTSTPSEQYTYDTLERVSQYQDAEAMLVGDRGPYQFRFSEGARSDRIQPSNPVGIGIYTVFFDTYRRPLAYMDELGRTTSVSVDGRGRVTGYTYPELDQEHLSFDDHNNVTQLLKIPKPNSGLSNITISASWDQTWNKPLYIVDALQNETDFTYYPSGTAGASLLHTATRPSPDGVAARPVYTLTYNSFGQLAMSTDPTTVVTQNSYDPSNNGNVLSIALDPAGINSVTQFGYDTNGNVTSVTDPRLFVLEYQYDKDRRKTYALHHNGNISAPLIAAEHVIYDVLGRETEHDAGTAFSGTSVSAWQTVSTKTYTATSKVLTEANGAANTTTYQYDPLDRVVVVTDPDSRRTANSYDLAGEVLCVWKNWPAGTATPATTSCDPSGWNPLTYGGGPVRYAAYTYSPNGMQATAADADNNLTTNVYDGFDRLFQLQFPSPTQASLTSNTADYEQYGWDANGNRRSTRLRDGTTIAYSYDDLNRLIYKSVPSALNPVYYGYDAAGRMTCAHYQSLCPTGSGVDYGFDSAKRVNSETTFGQTVSFGLDVAGDLIKLTWPDGNYVNFDPDALNRTWQIRENGATSGVGILQTYGYDPLSRIQTITRGNGTSTGYGYDLASRINALSTDLAGAAQDVSLGFTYYNSSQLKTRTNSNNTYDWTVTSTATTYVANGLNQYSSVSGTSYAYDSRGNLASDGVRGFTYDGENHLLTETGGAGLTLSYDPLGRLSQSVSGATTTNFLYAGDQLVEEYSGSGTVLRRYVFGPGTDSPILWYEGPGLTTRQWLHTDERGSIVAVSDGGGNGAVYTYDPYGKPNTWSGSRFRYTGQAMLPETQLYHYKARVYDPGLGRFLQTDPVGGKDDLNLYTYTHDDPIDGIDPTGEFDDDFFNHAYPADQRLMAMLGDAHIPGAFFVGSHGNQGGIMRTAATTPKEHNDPKTWSFVSITETLAKYPGNRMPIILYSCFGAGREAESLSRETGAVVYGAQDYAYARQVSAGVTEMFSAKQLANGTSGERSGFVPTGAGPRPFGDRITSILFDKNKGTTTVNWDQTKTGSRIPEHTSTTLCSDKSKCGN